MKTILSVLLIVAALAASSVCRAQNNPAPVPQIINQGFNAYAQTGLNAALQVWLQNSLLDRATLFKSESVLKQADTTYGPFERGEMMRQVVITPRVTRVYLVLYYERSPLWAYFDLYKTHAGTQVISEAFFNTKVQVILPAEFLAQ